MAFVGFHLKFIGNFAPYHSNERFVHKVIQMCIACAALKLEAGNGSNLPLSLSLSLSLSLFLSLCSTNDVVTEFHRVTSRKQKALLGFGQLYLVLFFFCLFLSFFLSSSSFLFLHRFERASNRGPATGPYWVFTGFCWRFLLLFTEFSVFSLGFN